MKFVVKVISIGNTCLDIILRPADRLPKWSTELFFKETQSRSGGQGLNFAVASALFGNTTLLASNRGMDQVGAGIEAELSGVRNLDLRFLRRTKEPTGFTVSVVRSDGERFFLAYLGHQHEFWTRKDREDICRVVERDDVVHISGYYMLPRLQDALALFLHDLRGRGVRISFDPGWPPSGFNARERANLKSILSCVDYFEPNETELLAMAATRTLDTAAKRIKRWFTGVLALKYGRSGSIIFAEDTPVYSKAFRIVPLDATGAGDVFDAAFLTGIIAGEGLKDAARRGNAAAGILMASAAWDLSRFPTKAALHKLLRKRN